MKFLRRTKKVLCREVCRIGRYPVFSTLLIILPVLSFCFFALLLEKGVPQNIPIAVCDCDRTELSRQLATMVGETPTAEVMYDITDMQEGEKMIREGKIEAILYIPENFERDIYSNTQTHVAAYINATNISANGLLNKDIQTAVSTFSAGVEIQLLMSQGLSETQAYAQIMPVKFDKHLLFNPYTNYGYYLLPSFMPMMLMIFTILCSVFAIGTELKNSTAGEWFSCAEGCTWAALIGKMLPYTLGFTLMSLLMNTIMYKWIGVPLNGNKWILILAGILFVLAYQAIGIFVITLLSNLRLSLSIAGGYSVLAFTFSGLTFPLMAMDWYIRAVSYIFPFTYYTEIFVDQAMRGAPVVYSIKYLGAMVLFIVITMSCLPRLKKIATHSQYWGRI